MPNHDQHKLVNLFLSAMLLAGLASRNAAAATACDDLASLAVPETVIASAQPIAAGKFAQPGVTGDFASLPAFCRVTATLKPTSDSDIAVEVWMPASGWNGKFQAVGNGGWAGSINYPALAAALNEGYATASTDTGHQGNGARFALGHPEKEIDFGYRAVHEMTVKSKAMIAAFYGRGPRLSYWNGCSNGGRQGLMEAQRYPADFDGILAGAPANYQTHLHAWSLVVGRAVAMDKESLLPTSKFALLYKTVIQTCDGLDGVKDGLLADPRKCHFDPSVLLCRGGDAENCLTAAQVEAAKKIYAPAKAANGKLIFPSMEPGSELGWGALAGGSQPADVALDTFRYLVYKDPNWDWRTFDLDRDVALADKEDVMDAIQSNMQPFKAHAGKLLMYHGWADQLIAPENSINFYSRVLETMGPKQDDWVRLFMVPGMQHCRGGPGPNQFDAMSALERWREAGIAPDDITAYHVTNNRVDMTRPLCSYPKVAKWNGVGSTNDASNFTCKNP